MDETQKLDRLFYSWNIFQNNREIIKLADNKIRYLFLVSSITATYILSAIENFESIKVTEILFLISFVLFLAFAFLTIKARSNSHNKTQSKGFIFYKNIGSFENRVAYAQKFGEATDEDLIEDLHFQIYALSKIAEIKYKYYNLAFIALSVQLVLFFIAMM